MNDKTKLVLVVGNTFPVKDQIKALGGRWNANCRGWLVPANKAAEAQKLIAGKTTPFHPTTHFSIRTTNGLCKVCGDDCGGTNWSCGFQ